MTKKAKTNANDNATDAAARQDAREHSKVSALTTWRRFLRENREGAEAAVNAAVKHMRDAKIFHPSEITRYRAQMINGVAVPDDFTGGAFAAHSRA